MKLAAFGIKPDDIGIPSTSTPNIGSGIASAVTILLTLAGMLAVIFMIVSGLQMVLARGDSQKFATARNTLLNAVMGLVIASSAAAVVYFVGKYTK